MSRRGSLFSWLWVIMISIDINIIISGVLWLHHRPIESVGVVTAWTPPLLPSRSRATYPTSLPHQRPTSSFFSLYASTLTKESSVAQTGNEPTPEPAVVSVRLQKAKLLLEQFTDENNFKDGNEDDNHDDDDNDDDPFAIDLGMERAAAAAVTTTASSSTKPTATSRSSAWSKRQQRPKKTKAGTTTTTSIDSSATTAVVPDTFWRNGHLMSGDGQNYVTRWARGVKVAEPLVKYDPIAAERLLFRQPTKWLVRNFQIALPIGWWAAGVVWDYITGPASSTLPLPQQEQQQRRRRRQRAQQLTQAISSLGPAIIKGGQALASRPDLLPSEYLEELQKLQDDVPRFSNARAFQTVEEELGMKFDDVFELVEDEPVAAASIGQVYKARLVANGDLVAIKIQRPGCEQIIALDLYVLRWWSGVYNKIFQLLNRDIDIQSIIDDFGELIYREIDYVAEAANAQRFNELYAGVRDVFVPKIYSDLTTAKVLTMEWVDGCRLTDQATLDVYGLDESKLVDTLVQCSLKQILGTNLRGAASSGD